MLKKILNCCLLCKSLNMKLTFSFKSPLWRIIRISIFYRKTEKELKIKMRDQLQQWKHKKNNNESKSIVATNQCCNKFITDE
jgi:hypothetical protein